MDEDTENDRASFAEKPGPSLGTRLLRYSILILILLALGTYIWKEFEVQDLEIEMENQRTRMAEDREKALDARTRAMLKLTALPLAWAVRGEMMRGNLSQIDGYFRDFVKEAGVQSIFLIGREDTVVIATNRKLEEQPADQVVSQNIQEAENAMIEKSDTIMRLCVPIMNFNEKLGILVMDYEVQASQAPALRQ